MTLGVILRAVLGVVALLLVIAVVWWAASCAERRKYDDRPPEVIEPEDIEEGLVHEPPSVLERIYIRELQPVRSGTAPQAVAAEVDSFVEAATKPQEGKKPKFPPVRGEWADDRLTLAVGRSDGSLVRNEYECSDPCRFWTQDTLMGAETTRALPRLLPRLGRTALVCTGVAAAGAGIAIAAKYEEPLLVAGVAGGSCVVLRMAF